MSEPRTSLGWAAFALIPIACCIGIPLIAAAGISVAVAAWAGGIVVGAVVLVAGAIAFGLRLRRRDDRSSRPVSEMRSRS